MTYAKKIILIFIAGCFIISCSKSNEPLENLPGGVRGVTKNSSTEEVIKDVFISTIPWSKVDSSNDNGRFQLEDLPVGEYFVFAKKDSFETERQRVEIKNGNSKELAFNLSKKIFQNFAPFTPQLLSPIDGEIDIRDSVTLKWLSSEDIDSDSVFYDVYFDQNSSPYTRVYNEINDTSCVIRELDPSSSYYWRIVATDRKKTSNPSNVFRFNTAGTNQYVYSVPEGKFPYPHHNPTFTEVEYYEMMEKLWIVDNFGDFLYHPQEELSGLSTGLTFYTGEGTKIFALDYGIVRGVYTNGPGDSFVVVEDYLAPGYAWLYRGLEHINYSSTNFIQPGDHLGEVSDNNMGFYTIERIIKPSGISWARQLWGYVNPDKYFIYEDTEEPHTPASVKFAYNKADNFMPANHPIAYPGVSILTGGAIDIIAETYDIGEYNRLKIEGFDSLYHYNTMFRSVEWFVVNSNEEIVLSDLFDFENLQITENNVFDLYVYPDAASTGDKKDNVKRLRLTNVISTNEGNVLHPENCWETAKLNSDGSPMYPNGVYDVRLVIKDYHGNTTRVSRKIVIIN